MGYSGSAIERTKTCGRPEQTIRPRNQNNGHNHKFGNQREFGEIHADETKIDNSDCYAKSFHFGDDHGCEISPGHRAHAADDDHHKRIPDRDQIGGEIGWFTRDLEGAAETCKRRAKSKYRGEQDRLVDTERADHLTVLCGRPYKPAEPCACERKMQHHQHQRTEDYQKKVIGG